MTSEWKAATIGSLCSQVFSGGTPASKTAAYFEGGTIPWLKTKEVNYCRIRASENFISELGLKNSSAKLVPVNSVIVAMYGNGDTAGRVAINKIPLTTNQACCNLVVDSKKADYRFVYYFLSARYQKLVDLKNGGAQQNLNAGLIKNFPISIPALRQQHQVSDFLEALDDRIELLYETNTTLESIAQALFKSWFVDFDPVRAKAEGREPEGMSAEVAGLFPAVLVQSRIGPVPKGWDLRTLQDLLVLQRGFDLPSDQRMPGNYPIIAASGPSGTHVIAMAKGPGVVTGRSGVLGKVFLELDDYWPLNTSLWVREFRSATPCYAYELLKRMDLASFNAGSAVPTLNRNHIHSLPCVIPPIDLVSAYEAIALTLHKRARENAKHAETLTAIRDALLPRLISGQLLLPEAEALLKDAA